MQVNIELENLMENIYKMYVSGNATCQCVLLGVILDAILCIFLSSWCFCFGLFLSHGNKS